MRSYQLTLIVIPANAGASALVIPAKAGIHLPVVIPAKAGIHLLPRRFLLTSHREIDNMDPRFRGDDGQRSYRFRGDDGKRSYRISRGMTTLCQIPPATGELKRSHS